MGPQEIYHHITDVGANKAQLKLLWRELILGILAGCYIGFGFSVSMLVAGQLSPELRARQPGLFNFFYGAFGFPMGLTTVVVTGASLFTSNVLYMSAALMERRACPLHAVRVLIMSYVANLAGSLLLGQLMIWGEVFEGREGFTIELAMKKTSHGFVPTMVKGILCNFLICTAAFMATAAQDVISKAVVIWLPVSAFLASGYEYSIANMFAIPVAMMLGADITVKQFLLRNLLPATLGNIIGGGVFVGIGHGLAVGAVEEAVVGCFARDIEEPV